MNQMLAPIEEALAAMREGRMLILVDDEDRENEGDIVVAASAVTAEQIAFMAKSARGLVCLAMDAARCDALGLDPMTRHNTAPLGTAFTVSIDARDGITTGISAADRTVTIRAAADPARGRADFVSPGSVFPLRAVPGGVLMRTGQTEGSVDLARLAGMVPAAVICEILRDDGTMMRMPDLVEFGARHGLPISSVADIVAYRLKVERLVEEVAVTDLPTDFGDFKVRGFRTTVDDRVHLALVMGEPQPDQPVLVRVHRANFPADTFPFQAGHGRADVVDALRAISSAGLGVFLYLNREETGADLLAALGAVQDREPGAVLAQVVGMESRMSFRDYGIGAQILRVLGVRRLRVLTNNPRRFSGLAGFDLSVEEFVTLRADQP
jgi:3,4-dihydroxy 2-butanone 4-phosphate synthase/GTP cyclohydrolase II